MKVITHPITSYDLVFIPRVYKEYALNELTSEVTQEKNGVSFTETHASPVTNLQGYKTITLALSTLNIVEGDSLTIKLSDNNGVVYRGKIYATNATDLQNFQLISVNQNVINL
tara:strand:+ start:66 stop:404 length:339 start_codon:yes stop_codon:yes gene_type:complete